MVEKKTLDWAFDQWKHNIANVCTIIFKFFDDVSLS